MQKIGTLDPCSPLKFHALILQLLADELSPLFEEECSNSNFSAKDQALANKAREIIQTEYETPPSILELARRVGVNHTRLKQLFHYYFATTPYAMLLDIRMHTAYQLLKTGNYHLNTVAYRVGYEHAHNFSAPYIIL